MLEIDVSKDTHDCYSHDSEGGIHAFVFTAIGSREGFEALFQRIYSSFDRNNKKQDLWQTDSGA